MSSSDQNRVRLTVTSADSATEIFVLDARFRLAKRGIGRLDEEFPPGLYVVRARSGASTREEVVLLPRGATAPVTAFFEPIHFGTPAPLYNTGKTHEYHIEFAKTVSSTVQVHAGTGSWLFIYAREWGRQGDQSTQQPARSPIRGLTLRALDGELIADLDAAAEKQLDVPDPCAACSIEIDPGAYRLVLEAAPGLVVEQSVVASPGWQTQVFLFQRDYAEDPEWRRADMVGASILMANGPGFDADHEDQRLAEMARLALRDGRRVLSEDLRLMLHGKYSDPMLGIFGAHLLLREQEIDEELYRIVVDNLRGLLGNHPDVEALSLRLRDRAAPSIEAPPMLRQSWQLILDATVTQSEIVPADSLLAGIAPRVWGEGPWLLWMERSEEELANDLQQIAQSMAAQVGAASTDRSATQSRASAGPAWASDSLSDSTDAGETSGAGASQSRGGFAFESMADGSSEAQSDLGATSESATAAFDDATVSRLVQSLGVPRSTIENMFGASRSAGESTARPAELLEESPVYQDVQDSDDVQVTDSQTDWH